MTITARLHPFPAGDLDWLRTQSDVPQDFYDDAEIDLDQAWDVLHRVLNVEGAGEWARQAVLGGEPFGESQGFGPCRTLTAEQVAAVAENLREITDERFRQLFAEADFADCYKPHAYPVDEALEEFRRLRDGYRGAAAGGRAMALFM